MYKLIKAKNKDIDALNKLAYESEAYWGYDAKFLDTFAEKFAITEALLNKSEMYMVQDAGDIIAFFSMMEHNHHTELQYFYVRRDRIGHGVGKLLWQFLMDICREMDIYELEWVTSPGAEPFYTKMGAEKVGEVSSSIDESKKIPKFKVNVDQNN